MKLEQNKKVRAFDILGNIALVKFPKDYSKNKKKKFAEKILKENSQVKTILEKSGNFKGRLRKMKTSFIAGEKTKEVLYKENRCVFRFNIDTTYFSSRLSGERKEIAEKIKPNTKVLVMFAGVAPYSIVIAKNNLNKKNMVVYSNEINREANKYAELNLALNKLKDKVILIPGDIKRLVKNKKIKEKFDVIVMPRPQLKDSFLKEAFSLSKKGTKIYYYDFCNIKEKEGVLEKIKNEAKNYKKKIKIFQIKNAGEIAPYKFRIRVDLEILN